MSRKIPFVNFKRHYAEYGEELDATWREIMSGGDFIMRRHLEEFEEALARYVGVKHAIGVNTGTDALYLSAHALGWGSGDEIITVGHTFVATLGAIAQCDATPVLVDIADDYNMDVSQVEEKITTSTKGIIPVHLNGHACRMDKIMRIARDHDLQVIEDAAQALGSRYQDQMVGSFGQTSILSFYPAKMLGTAGDGGMVFTDDDDLARSLTAFRDNGRVDTVEVVECFGWCSRLDNLHAALLMTKFKHFDEWVARRREVARQYDEGLSDLDGMRIHPVSGPDFHDVYQNYVIRVPERRDELFDYLREKGVETLISWKVPNHRQKGLGLELFQLPNTDRISAEVLSLPMYPEINDDEVAIVVDTVRSFFK